MSEAKKAAANSYVVVSLIKTAEGGTYHGVVIGSWSNKDKAVRQAFEEPGPAVVHVFNPVTGEMIDTITKG